MPASPDDGARHASRVLDVIAAAERALIAIIAARLRAGIAGMGWEHAKLAEVQMIAARLRSGVQRLDAAVARQVETIVVDAYNTGQALAALDIADAALPFTPAFDAAYAARAWARQATDAVRAALDLVPDMLLAVYHDAVAAGVVEVLGGTVTRLQAAQHVLDDLASRGVTGFTDRAGRNWALESYVEMAVRTGSGHAAVQGHVDALASSGLDLVIVSDAPRECPLCRPWERQILSISGQVGAVIEPNVLTGRGQTVHVKASLAEARAAGLQHPNCRHSIAAYLPGVTVKGQARQDPERYEAGQRQRQIERKIREWKRRQTVAMDATAERYAAGKVREWQAVMRAHVDKWDLTRLSRREQIGKAL